MIRNLNAMSFQPFGTVYPTRPGTDGAPNRAFFRQLQLTQGDSPVYITQDDTWLSPRASMAVLGVATEGTEPQFFYLDRPVHIRRGLYFTLMAMQHASSVEITSDSTPQPVENLRWNSSSHICRGLWIENLYTFFYQEREQGFIFPGESHPIAELTYVDQGTLHSVADGLDLLLEQGDIMIYTPNQWHMQYADMGVAPRFVTISFDFSGFSLDKLKNRKFKAPQAAVTLLQQMLREHERADAYTDGMVATMLCQLLLILLRQADMPSSAPIRASNAIHSENEIIRRAQQYISAHIREKLSVPLVARKVDVSASYLTSLFHKTLQISPGEYIRRVKLQESKQMIRENSMNFTEIASALQYSTVHHFSRQFKEKFGITPTEYAKSVR